MCESKVDPSEVRGVYEEWGWLSVKGILDVGEWIWFKLHECKCMQSESEWVESRQGTMVAKRREFERT